MRFQPPLPLQENIPVAEKYEKWLDWKGAFDVALAVCDGQHTEQQKVGLLFTSVGPETQRTIRLLGLPPMQLHRQSSGNDYEELSLGLNQFFRGMVDESVDYTRFHEAKQEPGEGIHKYTLRVRGLAACVNIAPSSFAFRHQVLKGMRDRELAVKAADESIILSELIQTAARKEQRMTSEAVMKSEPWRPAETRQPTVAALSGNKDWKRNRAGKRSSQREPDNSSATKARACRYCGRRQHEDKTSCPAYGKECHECGGANHFAVVCEKKKKKTVNAVEQKSWENPRSGSPQVRKPESPL